MTTHSQPEFGKCDTTTLPAFHLKAAYHSDCTGDVHNSIDVNDGVCIETDCKVASIDTAGAGKCPDGEVRLSYWEQPACTGKWYGYGYTSRNTCRKLWSDGWNFKSMFVSCAKPSDDCVNQGTCVADPEPARGICAAPVDSDVAYQVKTRYHADCTGDSNNSLAIKKSTGTCVNTSCAVASLDTSGLGDCPASQVRVSYWEQPDCAGQWYGYDYTSRDSCFRLWTDGYKFKSLYLSCASKSDDCVTKGTCKADPEPAKSIC